MSDPLMGSLTTDRNAGGVSGVSFNPAEMSPHDYRRVMSSEPFKVICVYRNQANEDKKQEFFIHSNLLASLSPSLGALVNGGMREAQEKLVTWEVKDYVFLCFAEFAYTGTYCAEGYLMNTWEEVINAEVIGADYAARLRGVLGQSVLHMEMMIFADYRGIQLLYDIAIVHLRGLLGSQGSKLVTPPARAKVIGHLGALHAPVHVMKDVLQIIVKDPQLLWEKEDFRSALKTWPDLQSEFLNTVMSNMGSNAL